MPVAHMLRVLAASVWAFSAAQLLQLKVYDISLSHKNWHDASSLT